MHISQNILQGAYNVCAKSLPPAWPRYAFRVLRQIAILDLIVFFFYLSIEHGL